MIYSSSAIPGNKHCRGSHQATQHAKRLVKRPYAWQYSPMMTADQKQRAIQIWQTYCAEGEHFVNASQEYTHEKLDIKRNAVIPEVLSILRDYFSGKIQLDEFKTRIDSINKRNRLWGFKGVNGQMFFNVLAKLSDAGNQREELDKLLKSTLILPSSPEKSAASIDEFASFSKSLGKFAGDRRGAPKKGSITFFLSYFWQIQSPGNFPIYYTSMTNVLQEQNIWFPSDSIGESYLTFFHLNHELLSIYSKISERKLTLWDVEHAFWFATIGGQLNIPKQQKPPLQLVEKLPDDYIPPIVKVLPQLSVNDPSLAEICQSMGTTIEKIFESRIAILFQMLGYEVEVLGQGHGRVPDGIALCPEYHYAIGYDAKVRQEPYTIGTDERAIREYISGLGDRLKKQGIKNLYFMIISSSFSSDHSDVIRSLKMEIDAREIILLEAGALVALLEMKLRDPRLSLGPDGIQQLLAESGILNESDVKEFQGI